jgi:hypothetical protein
MQRQSSKKNHNQNLNNGFLIAASVSKAYYVSAINLAHSILDFYPEAKITLCTQPELFEERHRRIFDVVDLTAPDHTRAKLYALPKTTYDITAYIDADCEVQDEDICTIFDQLGNNDIVMTKIRDYSGADLFISNTESLYWHCGVFLYNNKKKTLEMMQDWWTEYKYQREVEEWPWKDHSSKMRPWDQYTFYRLYTSKKYKSIKIDIFPGEDARWNYIHNYRSSEITKDPIIFHYTLKQADVNAGRINKKSIVD